MRKVYIISLILGIIVIGITIGLICYFNVSRVKYAYDSQTDSYYVEKVYGNAKTYQIAKTYNGKEVTKIGARAFKDKTNLSYLELPTSITEIDRLAFYGCKSLKNIDLRAVKIIGRNSFAYCHNLEQVESYAKIILGGAFYKCSNLAVIKLENTLSIGSYAFAHTAISSIVLPKGLYELGEGAFEDCQRLTQITCSPSLKNNSYLSSLDIDIKWL